MSRDPGPDAHPFLERPHRTLLGLAFPVVISLVAEPLTGLADTAFLKQLGSVELAALGVGATLLSSVLWVFNFLGIGTQTEVARALGEGRREDAQASFGLALQVSLVLGVLLALVAWPLLEPAARLMGADGALTAPAVEYLGIRLLGAPATLAMLASFGALRGVQDMRTPLAIALGSNLVNVALDPVLIFGAGPVPALGVGGAAWASTVSQWLAGGFGIWAARARIGRPRRASPAEALRLLAVGRDLFLRTGLLLFFLAYATRRATQIGADAGAAHQVIRQIWILTALLLDAYAAAAQSLVGYFVGAGRADSARRVARVASQWAVATGVVLAVAMGLCGDWVATLLVPPEALVLFTSAWWIAAVAQPLNAVSFVTDGIHWGTGDYRYLRDAMILATGVGSSALFLVDPETEDALVTVWAATALWISMRSVLGLIRIWPGAGQSPLGGSSARAEP